MAIIKKSIKEGAIKKKIIDFCIIIHIHLCYVLRTFYDMLQIFYYNISDSTIDGVIMRKRSMPKKVTTLLYTLKYMIKSR